jgi:hypothetical protein
MIFIIICIFYFLLKFFINMKKLIFNIFLLFLINNNCMNNQFEIQFKYEKSLNKHKAYVDIQKLFKLKYGKEIFYLFKDSGIVSFVTEKDIIEIQNKKYSEIQNKIENKIKKLNETIDLFFENKNILSGLLYCYRNYKVDKKYFIQNREKNTELNYQGYSFGILVGKDDVGEIKTLSQFSIQSLEYRLKIKNKESKNKQSILLIGGGAGGIDCVPFILNPNKYKITYNDTNPKLLQKFIERTGLKPSKALDINSIKYFNQFKDQIQNEKYDTISIQSVYQFYPEKECIENIFDLTSLLKETGEIQITNFNYFIYSKNLANTQNNKYPLFNIIIEKLKNYYEKEKKTYLKEQNIFNEIIYNKTLQTDLNNLINNYEEKNPLTISSTLAFNPAQFLKLISQEKAFFVKNFSTIKIELINDYCIPIKKTFVLNDPKCWDEIQINPYLLIFGKFQSPNQAQNFLEKSTHFTRKLQNKEYEITKDENFNIKHVVKNIKEDLFYFRFSCIFSKNY